MSPLLWTRGTVPQSAGIVFDEIAAASLQSEFIAEATLELAHMDAANQSLHADEKMMPSLWVHCGNS
eukprot:6065900-Amphidinium_carterae.1